MNETGEPGTHSELRDSMGRRRTPDQSRGLRPLYPPLDASHASVAVRIAMSRHAWVVLESAVRNSSAITRPRALGEIIERALGTSQTIDWQEWQIRKEKELLEKAS